VIGDQLDDGNKVAPVETSHEMAESAPNRLETAVDLLADTGSGNALAREYLPALQKDHCGHSGE